MTKFPVLLLLLLGVPSCLHAQLTADQRRGVGVAEPITAWIAEHADELDSNGDGILALIELMDRARSAFGAIDSDKNGVLEEMECGDRNLAMPLAGFVTTFFEKIDGDGNGVITAFEFADALRTVFSELDRNGDGTVSEEERSRDFCRDSMAAMGEDQRDAGPAEQPIFVLFLIDDMGWNAMGFTGNRWIETPRTDAMARQGMVFTNAYASAPNCAPTRACLMSGQYTPRHGVYTVVDDRHSPGKPHHKIFAATSREDLAPESVTIAESLKAEGYATAMFGMWNLGRGKAGPTTPLGQGFEVFKQPRDLGFEQDRYFNEKGEYLTDALTTEGIRWMETVRRKPFFLYMAYHAIHAPFEPKPDLLIKYQEKPGVAGSREDGAYAATVEAVDQNVGRIVDALERLGLSQKTVVFFHSDNGGTRQYIEPLSGGKGTLYEGGIRVPMAVWGPGIRQGEMAEPILSMDIYPTMLDLAGIARPENHFLDGESLAPILTGQGDRLHRDRVFWHFPCYIGGGGPGSAMRKGDWKVIEQFESRSFEVYHLASDPNERRNLVDSERKKTAELIADLRRWQEETGAPRPTKANPDYDPSARGERGGDRRKKGKNLPE